MSSSNMSTKHKCSSLMNGENFVLLYDNTKPDRVRITQEKNWEVGWSVLFHSPYSPDFTLTCYYQRVDTQFHLSLLYSQGSIRERNSELHTRKKAKENNFRIFSQNL